MHATLPSVLIAVVAFAVGCSGSSRAVSHPPRLERVTLAERKAILSDWYADGRIDGVYSCAVVRDVLRRLPTDPVYSLAPQDFARYAKRVC
jgi:hypothetical protein